MAKDDLLTERGDLIISQRVHIPTAQIEWTAIRAQGSGGQKVNKTSSAVHLRFDIINSSLPESYKDKLLAIKDSRVSKDGVLVIKSQTQRSQDQNRLNALERLKAFIDQGKRVEKHRIATKPTKGSQRRRIEGKKQRGQIKAGRGKISY